MGGRRTRGALLPAVIAAVLVPAGAARADTTVDFEQHPPGTEITTQYADAGGPSQGVVFGPLPGGNPGEGLHPVVREPPAGQAESGARVGDISTCTGCGEVFNLTPRTTGTFAAPRSTLSTRVGYLGEPGICTQATPDSVACAVVWLRAFDANGTQVAETSARVTRGAGVHTLLAVSTPSATIVGFEISARPTQDDNKPIAIDDLTFGTPPPPSPDFTLNPASTQVTLDQGGSATSEITIGRLGGSTGDIRLTAEGLPAGVTVTPTPNPAPGARSVLAIAAGPTTPPGTHRVTVTGSPQTPTAGPSPRSFVLTLVVQRACPEARTAQELVDRLAAGFECIQVSREIDLADVADPPPGRPPVTGPPSILGGELSILVIPEGVTLTGGRAGIRPGGMLFMSRRTEKRWMLDLSSDTRITGLRLRGYNERDRRDRDDGTSALHVENVTGVVIDNNEIFGWPAAGVEIADTTRGPGTPRVTRNFLHNNVQCNLGYGVVVGRAGFAVIDRNVFNYNRHDVAGSGDPGDGFIAEFNLSLTSGPKCDPGDTFQHYNQHYDMHGDRPGGTGGNAGTFMAMRRNTIRGAQSYYQVKRRPAFWLRGTPLERAEFIGNALHSPDDRGGKGAVRVTGTAPAGTDQYGPLIRRRKLVIRDNRTCVDTAHQLAVGDFDGDGREDVFQSVGTVWVYAPGGRREWVFLRASNQLMGQLGFGDFDGDRRTDVFIKEGRRWLVSDGGVEPARPLPAASSIDVREYRFGDFDGDRRTDVFRADGRRFLYSSAAATSWQPLASSRLELDDLRFGDFDGDGTTDVFSLANGQWSVSFAGRSPWRRLNGRLSSSLRGLVFADFNGDGRTDIARNGGGNWQVSHGGATPWRVLSFRRSEDLSVGMLLGDFNADTRDDVLRHGARVRTPSTACWAVRSGAANFRSFERFELSSAGAPQFTRWSLADMR